MFAEHFLRVSLYKIESDCRYERFFLRQHYSNQTMKRLLCDRLLIHVDSQLHRKNRNLTRPYFCLKPRCLINISTYSWWHDILYFVGNCDYAESTASTDSHTLYLIEDEGDVDKIIGTHENGTPYTEVYPVHDDDNDSVSSRYLLIQNNYLYINDACVRQFFFLAQCQHSFTTNCSVSKAYKEKRFEGN